MAVYFSLCRISVICHIIMENIRSFLRRPKELWYKIMYHIKLIWLNFLNYFLLMLVNWSSYKKSWEFYTSLVLRHYIISKWSFASQQKSYFIMIIKYSIKRHEEQTSISSFYSQVGGLVSEACFLSWALGTLWVSLLFP